MAMPKRKLGRTNIKVAPLIVGGHGLGLKEFMGKPQPKTEEAIKIMQYLVENGVTHFDTTYADERQHYKILLERNGLKGKILPCIWHGWFPGKQETADDVVRNFKYALDELGCEKAGMGIFPGGHVEETKPDWYFKGIEKVKQEGLADSIGYSVMAGGRLHEEGFYNTWEIWDFIAPYWNYSLRRQQFMVEFAREHGIGVYSVGAFGRGAFLRWPGVKPEEFVRPWIKWILREPSVFAFALSMSTLEEAKMAVGACDGKPMTAEEALYFHRMNFPIQYVDYRIQGRDRKLQSFEIVAPESHGSNMISDTMIRWKEK